MPKTQPFLDLSPQNGRKPVWDVAKAPCKISHRSVKPLAEKSVTVHKKEVNSKLSIPPCTTYGGVTKYVNYLKLKVATYFIMSIGPELIRDQAVSARRPLLSRLGCFTSWFHCYQLTWNICHHTVNAYIHNLWSTTSTNIDIVVDNCRHFCNIWFNSCCVDRRFTGLCTCW